MLFPYIQYILYITSAIGLIRQRVVTSGYLEHFRAHW